MQELIEKLQTEHGLTQEQSHGVLGTVTNFLKEKFPMIGSTLDNLMPNQNNITFDNEASTPNTGGNSFMDKISEAENFAKDKLGGMFGGNKTNP
jgi:hypothetical protein